MKLSTRNVLQGKVTEVKEGMIMAKVKVDLGSGNVITSLVSTEAVKLPSFRLRNCRNDESILLFA